MCTERGCGTDRACRTFDGRSATFKMFESAALGRQRYGSFHPTAAKRVGNYIYSKIISIFRFSYTCDRRQPMYFITIAVNGQRRFGRIRHDHKSFPSVYCPRRIDDVRSKHKSLFTNTYNTAPDWYRVLDSWEFELFEKNRNKILSTQRLGRRKCATVSAVH